MAIFPLAPDQTIAQMWSNGVWGETNATQKWHLWVLQYCKSDWPITAHHL